MTRTETLPSAAALLSVNVIRAIVRFYHEETPFLIGLNNHEGFSHTDGIHYNYSKCNWALAGGLRETWG